MTRTTTLALALSLLATACSKKADAPAADKQPAAKQVEAAKPAAPPAPASPFTFDAAAMQAKLQGAWVMKNNAYLGSREAWQIKGDQVTVWDARSNKETTSTLTIDAPCQYSLTIKDAHGSSGTTGHFVFDGDTLHMGLGDAGVKQGDKIIGCMSNGVFVIDAAGKCEFKTEVGHQWDSLAATCNVAADKIKVANATFQYDGEMEFRGAVLADDQLWTNQPAKVASYDEAKAQAKALVK